MENNKNKKSVKFQGDMLIFCDFIQVFVFTTNHHLKTTLGEWEHNNILCVFIFQIILIFDVFFSFKINILLVVYLKI